MIRPMVLEPKFVNHRALSGPTVIPNGPSTPGLVKSLMTPLVVIRPIDDPV